MLLQSRDTAGLLKACPQCGAREASICSAVEDEDLSQLALHAVTLTLHAGQSFIAQGAQAADFFVVTEGDAVLYTLLADGRRQVTGFARPGCFLGLAAEDVYAFGAEALTAMRLCRFTHAGMRLLTAQFPALERRLLTEASRELTRAQEHMLLLGRKTAAERLASFLLAFAGSCPASGVIKLPMTRTDIADYLGLTIETVSRSLNALRREGLIAIHHVTEIHLLDRPALAARAAGL